MPHPILKHKHIAGIIVSHRTPTGIQEGEEAKAEGGNVNESLQVAASDLIRAVHAKDEAGTCQALRAAFQILDAEPHEEGEHTNEPEQE